MLTNPIFHSKLSDRLILSGLIPSGLTPRGLIPRHLIVIHSTPLPPRGEK
jgi:hypothetical protein